MPARGWDGLLVAICAVYHMNIEEDKFISIRAEDWHLTILAHMSLVVGEVQLCFPGCLKL